MEDTGGAYRVIWWENLREINYFQGQSLDGGILLKWVFKTRVRSHVLDQSGSGYEHVAGCCECGNEPSGSIKCGEFLD
jgi:hypothetical protein